MRKALAPTFGSRPDPADVLSVLADQQIQIARQIREVITLLRDDVAAQKRDDTERDDDHGE